MSGHHVRWSSFQRWISLCWSYLLYDTHSTFRSQCSEAIYAYARLGKFNPSVLHVQNCLTPVVDEHWAYHTTWWSGVISSMFIYSGCKTVLHTQNTRVKLDEPSICRYGLGTLETKSSSVNHIVDMINIVMFTIENYSISRDDRLWFS